MGKKEDEAAAAAQAAAEAKRKADLAAELERKDDVELALFAGTQGVDIAGLKDRKDIVAAIAADADKKAAEAADKQRIADIEAQQAASIAGEEDGRTAHHRLLRSLNHDFSRDVPEEARSGTFEPDEDHSRFGGAYDIPNGKYRVVGSEWVFTIKNKKLAAAVRASEDNKFGGKDVQHVG